MNSNTNKSNSLVWLWLSLLIILVDQVTKYWISHQLMVGEAQPVNSFFSLVLFHNQGSAFNFLSSAGKMAVGIFSLIAVIVSLSIVIWLGKLPAGNKWQACALSFILGGALGNLIDRMIHGYVIDFLFFHYQQYGWPAFNVADSAITTGALMLIIGLFYYRSKRKI